MISLFPPHMKKFLFYYLMFSLWVMSTTAIVYLLYYVLPPKIATVDVTRMIDEFVQTQSSSNLSPEVLQANVTQFGQSLNKILQEVSQEKHLVLLPKEAVIAGSMDISQEIKRRLESEINQKPIHEGQK